MFPVAWKGETVKFPGVLNRKEVFYSTLYNTVHFENQNALYYCNLLSESFPGQYFGIS